MKAGSDFEQTAHAAVISTVHLGSVMRVRIFNRVDLPARCGQSLRLLRRKDFKFESSRATKSLLRVRGSV